MSKQYDIDLNNETELKDKVAEMGVGEKLKLEVTIKAKTDQTLSVVIDACEPMDGHEYEDDDDDDSDHDMEDVSDEDIEDMKRGPKPPKRGLGSSAY